MKKFGSCVIPALLLLAIIPGCDQSTRMERRNPEGVALVKSYFELLRSGHADQVEDLVDPSIRDSMPNSTFEQIVATIPREAPSSVKVVFVDSRCQEGNCQQAVVLEYRYPADRLLFNLALLKDGGHTSIVGLHITHVPDSFMKDNEFSFSNKGPSQYFMLTLAIAVALFSLYALILCLYARIGTRKWGWAAFILFGFMKLTANWTTGEFRFDFPALVFLWVDATHLEYGPWVVSVSLPVGAILFLVLYRKMLFPARAVDPQPDSMRS